MSNNLTIYGANAILAGTAMPATLWAKMHIGNPGPSALLNPSADTRRRSFTRGAGVTVSGSQVSTTLNDLEWLLWTANESLTYASIWDASVAGNPWWVGALSATVPILIGERLVISLADAALKLSFPTWS